MTVLAHIGGIPVQESLPFVIPVVALFLYGRHRTKGRRREVSRLPKAADLLDEHTTARVLAAWADGRHQEVAARHVALMYPPGPDGATAGELSERTGIGRAAVEQRLTELHELGYLDIDDAPDGEQRVALTIEGYDLLDVTEGVLLDEARARKVRAEGELSAS
jgi:hypothetical protein